MTIDRAEEFEFGRVISRTFSVLIRNAVTFLALAGILSVPTLLLTFYSTRNNPLLNAGGTDAERAAAMAGNMGQFFTTTIVTGFVGAVCAFILQAALVQGTVSDLNGEQPSFGRALSAGFKAFLPLLGIAILGYAGVLLGIMLLIVPGIILMLMWSVVVPVFVVEHTGVVETFGRSRALTRGVRWKIFGLILFYGLASVMVGGLIAVLFGVSMLRPTGASLTLAYLLASWAVRLPLTALLAVGVASIYYELRLVKEGVGPAQLAATFD